MKKKIIGIKLGSATLIADGKVDHNLIKSVCGQVSVLMQDGFGVFVVTSGAIASDADASRSRNLRSAVGQVRIMNEYRLCLEELGIDAAQILLTDEQLVKRKSLKTQLTKRIMLEAFSRGVVPIINANDVIDDEEINALEHCADNDKLFKLMCLLVGADVAIIGFDQLGFLDPDGRVRHHITASEIGMALEHVNGGSTLGHGNDGMRTKILVLDELAKAKIQACLVPAGEENFILRAVAQEKNFGTRFCG